MKLLKFKNYCFCNVNIVILILYQRFNTVQQCYNTNRQLFFSCLSCFACIFTFACVFTCSESIQLSHRNHYHESLDTPRVTVVNKHLSVLKCYQGPTGTTRYVAEIAGTPVTAANKRSCVSNVTRKSPEQHVAEIRRRNHWQLNSQMSQSTYLSGARCHRSVFWWLAWHAHRLWRD